MSQYNMQSLTAIIAKLRSKQGGCPWDLQQTHKSLISNLLEETYEVIEAINQTNPQSLAEELGDLLMQIVFHAQIAAENDEFNIDDVIQGICTKLIRRHPHVFADTEVKSVKDVMVNWEIIKKQEQPNRNRKSILDGIVPYLPALMKAEKVQEKAAEVGFEWDKIDGAVDKLTEELNELQQALKNQDAVEIEAEFGDILFSLVNVTRYLKINPELALNNTTDKFIRRFKYIEEQAQLQHRALSDMSLGEMDQLWEKAKGLPTVPFV